MLLLLYPYKFTNANYKKFQVKELKKKIKKFETHDLSNIISKKTMNAFKGKYNDNAKIFYKIKSWKNHLQKITKIEKKVYAINFIYPNSLKAIYINYLLSKFKVNIIEINSGETYQLEQSKTIKLKFINFFKYLIFKFPYFLFSIKNILGQFLVKLLKFEKVIVTQTGFDGRKNIRPILSNSKKIIFINYNSADYENFLTSKKKKTVKKYIVFLDSKTPAFIGDKSLYGLKINYDVNKWYDDLNNFLRKIEEYFDLNVIIIPHPSVREVKNIYYKKDFTIAKDHNAANNLISASSFVITISPTTAVSFCVLYKKPIVFIYNDQMIIKNFWQYQEMKNLSKILFSTFININQKLNINNFNFSINNKVYQNYKYNYLTSKEREKTSNIETLKKLLIL